MNMFEGPFFLYKKQNLELNLVYNSYLSLKGVFFFCNDYAFLGTRLYLNRIE